MPQGKVASWRKMSTKSFDFSLGGVGGGPRGAEGDPPGAGPAPDVAEAEVSRPTFWEDLYARGQDAWELGAPAPPLRALLARGRFPSGRAAVLGCGRGHDARLLAAHGHAVWGFDFSPTAIAEARRLTPSAPGGAEGAAPPRPLFEQRDVFSLPEAYPGFFELLWEYTCFCAIDPARRPEYVQVVRRILKPAGLLAALFYPLREGSGGPPFPTSQAEVRRLFEPSFAFLEATTPAESIERRRGIEWLVIMRPRRSAAPAERA